MSDQGPMSCCAVKVYRLNHGTANEETLMTNFEIRMPARACCGCLGRAAMPIIIESIITLLRSN